MPKTKEPAHDYRIESLETLYNKAREHLDVFVIHSKLDTSSSLVKEHVLSQITTVIEGQQFDTFARCHCGAIHGDYNIGVRCECGTVVDVEDPTYTPNVWYGVEEDEDFRFIHPYLYTSLAYYFRKIDKLEILRLISGKNITRNKKVLVIEEIYLKLQREQFIEKYPDMDEVERNLILSKMLKPEFTLSYFKENWEAILTTLANSVERYHTLHALVRYFKEREHMLFSTVLPLPSKRIITIERSKSKRLQTIEMSKRLRKLVDIHLASYGNKYEELDYLNMELALIWLKIGLGREGIISSKQGLVRHNLGSTSIAFGFRNPITLMDVEHKHEYETIHMPYGSAVAMFKYHIANELIKRGTPLAKTRARLARAVRNFDAEIYEILEERIIKRARGGKGFKVMLQRNPSQGQQAMQEVYITHVKRDPTITTVSCSDVSIEYPNADIDELMQI